MNRSRPFAHAFIAVSCSASLVLALTPAAPAGTTADQPDSANALEAVTDIPLLNEGVHRGAADSRSELSTPLLLVGTGATEVRIERQTDGTAPSSRVGGNVLFGHSDEDTTTVVQTLDAGGRILEVLASEEAPSTFTYDFDLPDGAQLVSQTDGSYLVGLERTSGGMVTVDAIGVVSPAWAVDAQGRPVPAEYSLTGSTLTMEVSPGPDVAYPVVADPSYSAAGFQASWTVWQPQLVTVRLNKARSEDYWDGDAVVCIAMAFIPIVGPVAPGQQRRKRRRRAVVRRDDWVIWTCYLDLRVECSSLQRHITRAHLACSYSPRSPSVRSFFAYWMALSR